MVKLESVYACIWSIYEDGARDLEWSADGRSWPFLYEVAAAAGLNGNFLVLDSGCGRGNHSLALCRQFGCRVIGIDVVHQRVRDAAWSDARLTRTNFAQASIERLPIGNGAIDFVWCADVLLHIRDLDAALAEFTRVLRCGGRMLALVTTQTPLMEPREAARLYAPLAIESGSLSRQNLEDAFRSAGLATVRLEELGAELAEHAEAGDGSPALMRLARMRRRREDLISAWGLARFETVYAFYHWIVYQLLGKLTSACYVLEKR
jgi:SAM-dependent methyltransferase